MRRFMVLVTVMVLMATKLVASANPVLARGVLCPCMYERNPYCPCDPNGTALPTVVCDVCADGSVIGWQNGQCWSSARLPQAPCSISLGRGSTGSRPLYNASRPRCSPHARRGLRSAPGPMQPVFYVHYEH